MQEKNIKIQVNKSEQITPWLSVTLDYDQPLVKRVDILNVLRKYLDNSVCLEKFGNHPTYVYSHDGVKEYLLVGSITYLSKPHPLFKKRYQLKLWYKDFYKLHSDEKNTKIRLIGIYHYDGLIVFVDFNTDDYINRKLNSSAAHVYSNDIYQAVVNGVFYKTDLKKNHITAIAGNYFKSYINGSKITNPILSFFDSYNEKYPFNIWIKADEAILEMKESKWYQWRGTEWAGWYLEYRFNKEIEETGNKIVQYIGNVKNKSFLDFDIYFPEHDFYGDLKSSDISEKETPLNDQNAVNTALNKYGKLWYVVYEHETIKDKDKGNEMAIKRMLLLGKTYEEGMKISYAARMKHSVNYKRMWIFELNRINCRTTLAAFNQGHQPNGENREPKYKLHKKDIDQYLVYSYDHEDYEV